MNWGHVVRNTAIAIGITFVTAVGVYLAIRLVVSALRREPIDALRDPLRRPVLLWRKRYDEFFSPKEM